MQLEVTVVFCFILFSTFVFVLSTEVLETVIGLSGPENATLLIFRVRCFQNQLSPKGKKMGPMVAHRVQRETLTSMVDFVLEQVPSECCVIYMAIDSNLLKSALGDGRPYA
jgi:hypothetical protein